MEIAGAPLPVSVGVDNRLKLVFTGDELAELHRCRAVDKTFVDHRAPAVEQLYDGRGVFGGTHLDDNVAEIGIGSFFVLDVEGRIRPSPEGEEHRVGHLDGDLCRVVVSDGEAKLHAQGVGLFEIQGVAEADVDDGLDETQQELLAGHQQIALQVVGDLKAKGLSSFAGFGVLVFETKVELIIN